MFVKKFIITPYIRIICVRTCVCVRAFEMYLSLLEHVRSGGNEIISLEALLMDVGITIMACFLIPSLVGMWCDVCYQFDNKREESGVMVDLLSGAERLSALDSWTNRDVSAVTW